MVSASVYSPHLACLYSQFDIDVAGTKHQDDRAEMPPDPNHMFDVALLVHETRRMSVSNARAALTVIITTTATH